MVTLHSDDAALLAKLIRHLNAVTSSDDAVKIAEACGWPGIAFPELFRRLERIADHLADD